MNSAIARINWLTSCPAHIFKLYGHLPNYSPEYIRQIFDGPGACIKRGALYNADFSNGYVTVTNGLRKTIGTPSTYENTIYILGPSWTYGFGLEDADTVASCLQAKCNNNSLPYRVMNYGVRGANIYNSFLHFESIEFAQNDICITYFIGGNDAMPAAKAMEILSRKKEISLFWVFYPQIVRINNPSELERLLLYNTIEEIIDDNKQASIELTHNVNKNNPFLKMLSAGGARCIDTQPLFDRPHSKGELFFDKGHLGPVGNGMLATAISDSISYFLEKPPVPKLIRKTALRDIARVVKNRFGKQVKVYTDQVRSASFQAETSVGGIVMNCNPFTNGHLFLIEEALKIVQKLYVFIVQEDKSYFSFEDRLNLVKRSVAHLEGKVCVVPSGQFIISSFSFPEYFTKETEKVEIDTSLDILLFGACIAPQLKITHRFAGKEPSCMITRQYNNTMRDLLPPIGIHLHVIPRKNYGDRPISASSVRKAVAEGNYRQVKELVPQETLNYLCTRGFIKKPTLKGRLLDLFRKNSN